MFLQFNFEFVQMDTAENNKSYVGCKTNVKNIISEPKVSTTQYLELKQLRRFPRGEWSVAERTTFMEYLCNKRS